jgi:2'-5' RNA ligase
MPPIEAVTLERLSECFGMPAKDAAAKLGMCVTSLKKAMRKHGEWYHKSPNHATFQWYVDTDSLATRYLAMALSEAEEPECGICHNQRQ